MLSNRSPGNVEFRSDDPKKSKKLIRKVQEQSRNVCLFCSSGQVVCSFHNPVKNFSAKVQNFSAKSRKAKKGYFSLTQSPWHEKFRMQFWQHCQIFVKKDQKLSLIDKKFKLVNLKTIIFLKMLFWRRRLQSGETYRKFFCQEAKKFWPNVPNFFLLV